MWLKAALTSVLSITTRWRPSHVFASQLKMEWTYILLPSGWIWYRLQYLKSWISLKTGLSNLAVQREVTGLWPSWHRLSNLGFIHLFQYQHQCTTIGWRVWSKDFTQCTSIYSMCTCSTHPPKTSEVCYEFGNQYGCRGQEIQCCLWLWSEWLRKHHHGC